MEQKREPKTNLTHKWHQCRGNRQITGGEYCRKYTGKRHFYLGV